MYTGSEHVGNGAIRVQGGRSYEQQAGISGSASWQQPVNYPSGKALEASGGECGHDMRDDSRASDEMDTVCDLDLPDDYPEATVERDETVPPSALKQEEVEEGEEVEEDEEDEEDEEEEGGGEEGEEGEEESFSSSLKQRRSALSPTHRKQTAETRKIKACTRCRSQKLRCETDPEDPTGECIGCKTVSKTSKKTIHRMPCFRGKITDAILFRSGGLQLTRRWKGTEMKDVGDRINPEDVRTISFTLGICAEPIKVDVVAFQAQPGDVTARFWMASDGEHGVRRKKDLAHYCLADIQKTATYFEAYVKRNALKVLNNERAGGKLYPQDIIEKTYAHIIHRYHGLTKKSATTGSDEIEIRFMENIFILWFAMRHSTGSSWICGEELLGMKPETKDETYPLFGRVSVPRMILAQFDSINYNRLLTKYGKLVLSELEAIMSRRISSRWFSVYAGLFILLREASWISEDRYRHARSNYGQRIRYSIPAFVESLHESCNNLLQHWHYFNWGSWPSPADPFGRHKTQMGNTPAVDYHVAVEAYADASVQRQLNVWRRYKEGNGRVDKPTPPKVDGTMYEGRQVHYDWDHPFYWVSQLFEENWQPHPTYQRERE
ncbi:hypothetical protein Trco_007942 [Trichoderma cornu-damae]|uniref:Zn(2)-C6 fungal-type domain-containing protein n=1 Tax=Trichoderma cornu-damae TaxID=654480 RepID=A0A9P8QIF3_9HYPO|nr:hypothetical protein Trco_007942 [Trichoderma cornu-damae]